MRPTASVTRVFQTAFCAVLFLAGCQGWVPYSHEAGSGSGSDGGVTPAPECHAATAYASTVSTFALVPPGSAPDLVEPSGLAASWVNPGVLYTHNEDTHDLFLIDASGLAARYRIEFPFTLPMDNTNPLDLFDWEDVAVGPCGTQSCVYMGDIGKNSGTFPSGTQRTEFALYRIPEPVLGHTPSGSTLSGLERFPFRYPDGAYDAEALMVHPTSGDVYVLTKGATATRVYRFPRPLQKDVVVTLSFVQQIDLPTTSDTNFARTTAADIHPCGDRFLLRTYRRVYEFLEVEGQGFESAFSPAQRVDRMDTVEGQGESVAYALDGSAYYTLSETAKSDGRRLVLSVEAQ